MSTASILISIKHLLIDAYGIRSDLQHLILDVYCIHSDLNQTPTNWCLWHPFWSPTPNFDSYGIHFNLKHLIIYAYDIHSDLRHLITDLNTLWLISDT